MVNSLNKGLKRLSQSRSYKESQMERLQRQQLTDEQERPESYNVP